MRKTELHNSTCYKKKSEFAKELKVTPVFDQIRDNRSIQ